MAGLRREFGFDAVMLHLDHGIRADSREDARFVRRLAATLGLPCRIAHAKVRRGKGESLEMAARRERLAFFERMVSALKLDAIATGHHADDVAETMLMRLARGAGPAGLAGIKRISRVGNIVFIRPLLDLRDSDLRAFLVRRGIAWREDSTNADISILRNKVRHVVLPWLKANFDRRMTEHLCKSAAILRGELQPPQKSGAVPRKAGAVPPPERRFTLSIGKDTGFERRRQEIGRFPAVAWLDGKGLAGRTLELRHWRAGDRIVPTGMGGKSRKLQDVFVTCKTPPALRRELPLLADAATGEILWVPGYRVAEAAAVTGASAPSWRFTLSEGAERNGK